MSDLLPYACREDGNTDIYKSGHIVLPDSRYVLLKYFHKCITEKSLVCALIKQRLLILVMDSIDPYIGMIFRLS